MLQEHMKVDPITPNKIEYLKNLLMEELEECLSPRSRRGSKKGLASASSKVVDSEDDIDPIDEENTSMQDLIK